MSNRLKDILIISSIVVFFLLLTLPILTEYPLVFPDETSFANAAYALLHQSELSVEPFKSRVNLIAPGVYAIYGPVYIVTISLIMKLFGYSIIALRSISLLFAGMSLILFYLLLKRVTNTWISTIGTVLLAIDIFFLSGSKLGRMETLVIFLILIAYHYYLFYYLPGRKTLKDTLILSFVVSASFFTHFAIGTIPMIAIGVHEFLREPQNRIRRLIPIIGVQVILFIIWLFFAKILAPQGAVAKFGDLVSALIITHFYSVIMLFLDTRFHSYVNFLIVLSGVIFAFLIKKKDTFSRFFVINYFVVVGVTIWSSSSLYMCLLALGFIPLFMVYIYKQKEKTQFFLVGFAVIIFTINLIQQFVIINTWKIFSYTTYAKNISNCIPKNARVYLPQLTPDPYFYLFNNRRDLTIAYQDPEDVDRTKARETILKADHFVTFAVIAQILKDPQYIAAQANPEVKQIIDQQLRQMVPLHPDMINYLYRNTTKICVVEKNGLAYPLVVFTMKPSK